MARVRYFNIQKLKVCKIAHFFVSVPLARENLKGNLKHKNRAIQLTNVLAVDPPAPPSERLLHVLIRGLNQESEEKAAEDKAMKKNAFADLTIGPSSRTELLESLQGTIHILRKHFYSTKGPDHLGHRRVSEIFSICLIYDFLKPLKI